MPLVLILDSDGKTNKVPINGKKVEETDEIICRMIKTRKCVIKKVAGGLREGVTGSKGLFYCSFSHNDPIHFECYTALVSTSYANKHLICQVDGKKVAMFVCGKRCYNVYKKVMIGRSTDAAKKKSKSASMHWKTDGSEQWLVQWLSDEVNCSQ